MERLTMGHDEITLFAATDAILAAEVTLPAGGGPPVMHSHRATEVYRVLEGEFTFHLEDAVPAAGRPGDVVHIPGGAWHTIRNHTDRPARAFVVFADGNREMEGFLRSAAALDDPAPAEILAAAAAHGIVFSPGSPPAP